MANPSGRNSPVHFEGFTQNPPVYGDRERQSDLARSAPDAGAYAAASALNTPQRSQRKATRPTRPRATPAPAVPVAAALPASPSYPAQLAATWAQVASIPGASLLVQQIAQEAQLGSQS